MFEGCHPVWPGIKVSQSVHIWCREFPESLKQTFNLKSSISLPRHGIKKTRAILKLKHKNTDAVEVSEAAVPLVDITSLLIVPL